jgi:hypothetical protein
VPTGRQRTRFGLAVTDHAGDDQVRVIKRGTIGMRQAIAEFAAFMDRARNLRRHMAGDPVWPGKLPKQAQQAVGIALNRG